MAAGSGRAAIFPPPPQWGSKRPPYTTCMLGLTLFHVSKMGPRASPEIDFKMYSQTDNWFVNVNVLQLVDFVFTFRSDLSVF